MQSCHYAKQYAWVNKHMFCYFFIYLKRASDFQQDSQRRSFMCMLFVMDNVHSSENKPSIKPLNRKVLKRFLGG